MPSSMSVIAGVALAFIDWRSKVTVELSSICLYIACSTDKRSLCLATPTKIWLVLLIAAPCKARFLLSLLSLLAPPLPALGVLLAPSSCEHEGKSS